MESKDKNILKLIVKLSKAVTLNTWNAVMKTSSFIN